MSLDMNCDSGIVYKAEVSSSHDDGQMKQYIGMTANTFKEIYCNHKKSSTNAK